MAIAFDAASGNFVNPGTSLTVSHTCTGSDLALVVAVTDISGASVVSGVTYNSVAMTKVDEIGANRAFTLWYLTAPDTGAHDIVVTAGSSTYIGLAAASYTGVLQTGQPEVEFESSGASPLALGLTTLTDNSWVIAGAKAETGNTDAGTGATRRATDLLTNPNGITAIFDSNAAVTPAGAYALAVTGSTNLAGISIALAPSGAAPPDPLAPPGFTRRLRFFKGR